MSISNHIVFKTVTVFNSAPFRRLREGIWAYQYGLSISQVLSGDFDTFRVVFKLRWCLLQRKLPFHVLLMRDKMGGSSPNTYFDTISQQLLCVNLVWIQFELRVNNGNFVLIQPSSACGVASHRDKVTFTTVILATFIDVQLRRYLWVCVWTSFSNTPFLWGKVMTNERLQPLIILLEPIYFSTNIVFYMLLGIKDICYPICLIGK